MYLAHSSNALIFPSFGDSVKKFCGSQINSSKPTSAVDNQEKGKQADTWREIHLSFETELGCTRLRSKRAVPRRKASLSKCQAHQHHQNCTKVKQARDQKLCWIGVNFSDTPKTLLWKEVRESYHLPDVLSPVQFLMASQLMLCLLSSLMQAATWSSSFTTL